MWNSRSKAYLVTLAKIQDTPEREVARSHSSCILSFDLIGQHQNKRFYVTQIVLPLGFADFIFRKERRDDRKYVWDLQAISLLASIPFWPLAPATWGSAIYVFLAYHLQFTWANRSVHGVGKWQEQSGLVNSIPFAQKNGRESPKLVSKMECEFRFGTFYSAREKLDCQISRFLVPFTFQPDFPQNLWKWWTTASPHYTLLMKFERFERQIFDYF